jgi:Zn-dependent M32 family carboxypeptidase
MNFLFYIIGDIKMAKKSAKSNGSSTTQPAEKTEEAGLVNLTDAQVNLFFDTIRSTIADFVDKVIEENVSKEARAIPDVRKVYEQKHQEKFKFLLSFMIPRNVQNDVKLGRRVRRSDNRDKIMKLL